MANKVYNITSYVEDHPGGSAILNYVGGDSTVGFNGPQHASSAKDVLGNKLCLLKACKTLILLL